jgi:hypothetical protein
VKELFDNLKDEEEEEDDFLYDPKKRKNLRNLQFKKRLGGLKDVTFYEIY